ncbi:MAG TPA: family 43 glycosylhydrolase [Acidisarcina sp.]|nr:family 43 glycosylhydrolase [Acidisarcina sp.]
MKFPVYAMTILSIITTLSIGCGGSGTSSTTTSSPGAGSSSTPDSGTLTSVSDNLQYRIRNASSGLELSISGQSQVAGASVVQAGDAGTPDQLWHFVPMGNQQFNVENLATHQVMGITNASKASGAAAVQWADNGTSDHLWQFYLLADGNYLIKNANSGLYLEDGGSNATSAAVIDQGARATTGTGCTCQEWALTSTGNSPYPAPLPVAGAGVSVHDPYMLKDTGGTYWLYGTHSTLASSADMVNFTFSQTCTAAQRGGYANCPDIGPDLALWSGLQTPPSWNNGQNTDIWAPDVLYANGTYFQYYSIPIEPHSGAQAIIGLTTSANPNGPWTDAGQIIESYGSTTGSTTRFNAIDPAPFVDASGNRWLVFGSWEDGIHVIQLDPATGLRLSSNPTIYNIAQRGLPSAGEEGPFIYPFNGWYYYFASINVCCSGNSSTYRIIVGRSKSPTGPYLDRGGLDLMQGGGTILLSAHGNVNGPGGQSVFTDGSQPTLVYHYYDGNNNGWPALGINRLGLDADGWPYVE